MTVPRQRGKRIRRCQRLELAPAEPRPPGEIRHIAERPFRPRRDDALRRRARETANEAKPKAEGLNGRA